MADLRPGGVYPVRLPFAGEGTGRDAAFTKDRYYKNLFIEQWSDKQVIVKRPGLQTLEDGGDVCHDGLPGLGLYNWEGILISVFGSTIYSETIGAPVVWTQVEDMPASLCANYGVAVGDDFYSFGGHTSLVSGTNATSAVYKYVKATDTWSSVTTMPQGNAGELMVTRLQNGQVYVGGGIGKYSGGVGDIKNSVYWYNPATNAWTQKANLPIKWYDARIVTLSNGKVFICGGRDASNNITAVTYLYNPLTDTYTAAASMSTARSNFALVGLPDGRVMAIGGNNTGTGSTAACEIYDPATNAWSSATSLPTALQYSSAAVDPGGNVYVWGGIATIGGTPVDSIYLYSIERDAWEQLVAFPRTFYASAYARYDDGVYINAGGATTAEGVLPDTYITAGADSASSSIQCTSLGSIIDGEPGVSFAEIFTDAKKLLIKTSDKLYVVDRATLGLTTVSDVDYPAATVPGVVTLDGYTFVMDADGTIYNSDLEDPTAWDSLNFINAEIEADDGVALAKHLNYVLALGTRSYELFYNAANDTGSPLARIEQAFKPIGCIAPWSVTQIGDLTLWIGSQSHDDPVVVALNGFEASVISDPVIQRILKGYGADLKYARGVFLPVAGHAFYVIQLGRYWNQFDRTLVYDLKSLKWYEWTSVYDTGESAFNLTTATVYDGQTLAAGLFDGVVYQVTDAVYLDGSQVIRFEARTEPWDAGIAARKFVSQAKLIGDRQTGTGTIDLAWSDDNYKTFSTARSIDLTTLTGVTRLGQTDRRVWRVKSEADLPIRLDGVEVVYSPGEYLV